MNASARRLFAIPKRRVRLALRSSAGGSDWLTLLAASGGCRGVWRGHPRGPRPRRQGGLALLPYRVQVFVAASPRAARRPPCTPSFVARLSDRIVTVMGAGGTPRFRPLRRGCAATCSADSRTSSRPSSCRWSQELDKISARGGSAPCRTASPSPRGTFDVPTQMLSTPVSRHVWQIGAALCDTAFDAMLAAFAPLGRVEAIDGRKKAQSAPLARQGGRLAAARSPPAVVSARRRLPADHAHSDRQNKFRRRSRPCGRSASLDTTTARGGAVRRPTPECGGTGQAARPGRAAGAPGDSAPRPTTLYLWSEGAEDPLSNYQIYCGCPAKRRKYLGRTDRLGRIVVPPGDGLMTSS